MIPTAARCSKASRAPLTPKRGNKDFYKGTRQAFLPGGRRTGAPGAHVIRGKAKYRLVEEKVRVFVAPPIAEIEDCELRPYVALGTHLSLDAQRAVLSKMRAGGLTPTHFLRVAREQTYARRHPTAPVMPADLRAALAAVQSVTSSPRREVADAMAAAKSKLKIKTKSNAAKPLSSETIKAAQERKDSPVPQALRREKRALEVMQQSGPPSRSLLRVMRRTMPALSGGLKKRALEAPKVPDAMRIAQPASFPDLSFSSDSNSPQQDNTLSLSTPNLPAWLRAALALRAKDTPQARREAQAEEERARARREGRHAQEPRARPLEVVQEHRGVREEV